MQDGLNALSIKVQQLTITEFTIVMAIFASLVIAAFYFMVKRYKYARLIENVPTARIRSAPQGYVELVGNTKFMEGPIIVSPLSGTHCVWFRYSIEEQVTEYEGKGRINKRWKVIKRHVSDDIFLLDDGSDVCVIDPDGADVIPTRKQRWFKRDTLPVRRYTEWTILEGDALYALGQFEGIASVENNSLKVMTTLILKQWKNDPNDLLHRYDLNRDNKISQREWEQARKDAFRQASQELGSMTKHKQLNMLKASSHKSQPYILSTIPEDRLIAKHKITAFFCFLGFISVGICLVWLINQRLGM
ncbi:MAG TPA: hypothetical protein ENI26_03475 [Methylophaga aminisulfidivorans]|uniref:RING-type E3 ubiquitin transferase n=1 Tax=Methylophaga aminisulfidivorans TaxID=230105 RepID=A0A7C1VZI5_9GAMM|nr:hypothetical protein [Methylophaga aminisulfidivorans]